MAGNIEGKCFDFYALLTCGQVDMLLKEGISTCFYFNYYQSYHVVSIRMKYKMTKLVMLCLTFRKERGKNEIIILWNLSNKCENFPRIRT